MPQDAAAGIPRKEATGRLTRGAVTLARVRRIPIRAHWSLLVALPFFAWLMASVYFDLSAEGWAWGAALAVVLFVSVTLHELAHSLVALRLGTRIREIILLPIGGASVMAHPPRASRIELLVAGAGPLASLVIGGALLLGASILGVPWTTPAALAAPAAFVLAAGYLNVVLGLFNLLVPAFPMDGGRVLRALLGMRLGFTRATAIAARIGRGFAVLMGLAGLLVGNIFLVVIAIFVWFGASTEERSVRVTSALEGVSLADVMTEHPTTIAPDATAEEALRVMLESKHVVLPVVDDGRPVGVLRSEDIARVPPPERAAVRVADIAHDELQARSGSEPAGELVSTIVESGIVAVVDASRRLLGVVTPTDVLRTVQLMRLR